MSSVSQTNRIELIQHLVTWSRRYVVAKRLFGPLSLLADMKKKKATHSLSLSFLRVVASILPILSHDTRKKKLFCHGCLFPTSLQWLEAHVEWAWCEGILCFVLFKVGKKKSCQKKRPPKRTRAIKYAIKFRDLRGMEKGKEKKCGIRTNVAERYGPLNKNISRNCWQVQFFPL